MNVSQLFARQAVRAPEAVALVWDDGEMTYGALLGEVRNAARLLASLGVGSDDRVAILLSNEPAFAVALLATHWLGATAAVLSPAWAAADAEQALARADARVLVTTAGAAAKLSQFNGATLHVDEPAGPSSWRAALRRHESGPMAEPAPRAPHESASILFSSGTTGEPKGVVLTHGNLVFNALAKIRYCGFTSADRIALVVPIAHCFGQNVVLLGALLSGATVRLFTRFDAEVVHHAIAVGDVSVLMAAPPAFRRLLERGSTTTLRQLRYALSAAAPLPNDVATQWAAASGRPLHQGYGMTESSPFATYNHEHTYRLGSVGAAIDLVQVRVISLESDEWATDGEAGEVAIRGPNVMQGYWRDDAATAHALRDGWLRTGDVGRMDADGYLTLVDRLDDVINVAGFKAYPSDVERAVAMHPDVREVAAYAVPDHARGSAVAVTVVLAPGARRDGDAIASFTAARVAGFQRPSIVRFADALPRSASGKVLRRVLAADFQLPDQLTPANTARDPTGLPEPSR